MQYKNLSASDSKIFVVVFEIFVPKMYFNKLSKLIFRKNKNQNHTKQKRRSVRQKKKCGDEKQKEKAIII